MSDWKNFDTLDAYKQLQKAKPVNLQEALSGATGAARVKNYSIPMAAGMTYNYAAKQVDDEIISLLVKLAEEAQLAEKYKELYNGAVINTGEKRMVLHQLTRCQLGDDVVADGVNKRDFYIKEQKRIAEFAEKVHSGAIANGAGEKFTTVCQIGIGGSDLSLRRRSPKHMPRKTTSSKWKPNSSVTWIPMTLPQSLTRSMWRTPCLSWCPSPVPRWRPSPISPL